MASCLPAPRFILLLRPWGKTQGWSLREQPEGSLQLMGVPPQSDLGQRQEPCKGRARSAKGNPRGVHTCLKYFIATSYSLLILPAAGLLGVKTKPVYS